MLALIAAAATSLSAPPAVAQTVAPSITMPRYERGDAFVFSDGRVERVVAADGERMTWAGLGGASYKRSRNFIVPVLQWRSGRASGLREIHGNPDALWPLDRPKSARFRVVTETKANPQASGRRSVSLWVCKTGKARMFTVPIGEYRAIPILCDRYSPTTMRLLERREWDYAPELGHYIRRVTVNYLRGTSRSADLVAALSGPAANKARLTALSESAKRARKAQLKTGGGAN
jgi:hypothetical protein